MNSRVAAVLQEYAEREAAERLALHSFDNATYLQQRENMLLGIGPETGQFLNLLIKAQRAKNIVEVGTSFGYSTLWLAEAAASTGAIVTSFDLSPEKQTYAAEMMRKAGLQDHVRFVSGDALTSLREYAGPIDFALIDLWKDMYIPAFDRIYPKLSQAAIVCADNMLFPDYQREAAKEYIAHVCAIKGAESVTLAVGSGVEFTMFTKPEPA